MLVLTTSATVFIVALSSLVQGDDSVSPAIGSEEIFKIKPVSPVQGAFPSPVDNNKALIEPRNNAFVKEIVDRLHALDADIGKLLYNSTSMYSPSAEEHMRAIEITNEPNGGGQKFSEVLSDLDSLQDEIAQLVSNATRTRQYNIIVRLRPLNGILYRIRHNLHLMRNSLVAINTVSGLEKIGNSVLDSTLTAFMRPDANLSDEIGDNGNYDINLDKGDSVAQSQAITVKPQIGGPEALRSVTTSSTTATPSTSPPTSSSTTLSTTIGTTAKTTITTTTKAPATSSTTRRNRTRPPIRRTNQRQNNRRNTTTTTTKAPVAVGL